MEIVKLLHKPSLPTEEALRPFSAKAHQCKPLKLQSTQENIYYLLFIFIFQLYLKQHNNLA